METQPALDLVNEEFRGKGALRLLKNIAAAANMARSVNDAFTTAGEELLAFTGWFGVATFLVDEKHELVLIALHGPVREEALRQAPTMGCLLGRKWVAGLGIPGKVLESKRPIWTTETDILRSPEDYPHAHRLLDAGAKTAVAFPVMSLDRVAGVLMLFSREELPPDPVMQDLMVDVGVQLGRVVEREAAAEERRSLSQLLETIIDSMPSGLIAVDKGCKVIEWNLEAALITKVTMRQAVGKSLSDVFPLPQILGSKISHAAQGQPVLDEAPARHAIEGGRLLEITIYPLCVGMSDGAVIRLDDVTRRTQMEQLIVHSEKMLSVGGLAAGVAHEINNPLAGMVQNAQVAQNRIQSDAPANHAAAQKHGTTLEAIRGYLQDRHVMEMLEAIRTSGARAADIIRAMMGFTQANATEMQPCDLKRIIDQAVELVASDFELRKQYDFRSVKVTRDYADGLQKVQCHPTEIQQVMLNLLKNAAQAAAEQKNRTTPLEIVLRLGRDGNAIRIDVEDDGPGMGDRARLRVFEPFFTTKDPNIGTGLGLSVSYYIITQNHHGQMTCAARDGGGTVFTIVLPIHQQAEANTNTAMTKNRENGYESKQITGDSDC